MNESGKAFMAVIPEGKGSPVLIYPGEQMFDLPSVVIAPKRLAILSGRADEFGPMRGGQFNSSVCQLLIERITVIGMISHKSSGVVPR